MDCSTMTRAHTHIRSMPEPYNHHGRFSRHRARSPLRPQRSSAACRHLEIFSSCSGQRAGRPAQPCHLAGRQSHASGSPQWQGRDVTASAALPCSCPGQSRPRKSSPAQPRHLTWLKARACCAPRRQGRSVIMSAASHGAFAGGRPHHHDPGTPQSMMNRHEHKLPRHSPLGMAIKLLPPSSLSVILCSVVLP